MADTHQLGTVIQKALYKLSAERHGGLLDSQLLERFAADRDVAAFETLVWRHGPMVLATCRRILHQAQDAEDAFQATFLVLCRKAHSIRKLPSCGAWLHKVAYHIALKARARAAKRSAAQKQVPPRLTFTSADDVLWRDLRPVLDEELNRLPEKYRVVLVLHYLEGKTVAQVAEDLGWRPGTVSGRLARAKSLLRTRLTLRGLGMAGAASLTAALVEQASAGILPAAFVHTAVAAATAVAETATLGTLTTAAVTLANGTLRTMMLTKLKTAAVLLLGLTILAVGAGVVADKVVSASPVDAPGEPTRPGLPEDNPKKPEEAARPRPVENKPPKRQPQDGIQPGTTFAKLQALPFQGPQEAERTSSARDGNVMRTLLYSPDGKRMTYIEWLKDLRTGWQTKWHLQDAATGKDIIALSANPHCVMYSPDGKILAGSDRSSVNLFDAATGKSLRTLTITVPREGNDPEYKLEASISSFAFSPDGKKIAAVSSAVNPLMESTDIRAGSMTPLFTLWEEATGKQLEQIRGKPGNYYRLIGFSKEPPALKASESVFHYWGGAIVKEFGESHYEYHGPAIPKAYSPNGKITATPDKNFAIHLSDAKTGKELLVLCKHQHEINSLAFSPDGRYLASGDMDGRVYLWVVATGKLRWVVADGKDRDLFEGYDQWPERHGWIDSVFFSPDGTKLVTVAEGRARVGGYGIHLTHLWNLYDPKKPAPGVKLSAKELESLWVDLADADSGTAYGAVMTLIAAPEQAPKMLADKTRSLFAPYEYVARLVAQLDNDDFGVRERATAELARLGEMVQPILRQALQQQPGPEVRHRLEKVLEQKKTAGDAKFGGELLRGTKAVDVLETIGTPEALAVLKVLANGTPGVPLTEVAAAALKRNTKE